MIGPRDGFPRDLHPPHNPGMTMIGAGMLWVGWYGFNGGSALAANGDAAMALLVTHISASTAGLVWALIEKLRFGRSSMVGLVTGVVAGLAAITPASGYVGPIGALMLGAVASIVCFTAVDVVKQRCRIDDSLDVFAVHGVGGILGSLLVAVFASKMFGGAGYAAGVDMGGQAVTQIMGVLATLGWSAVATVVLLIIVKRTVGLRASDAHIEEGLDLAAHGERAFTP
jgi:Amt family ammonium transporter